MHDSTKKEARAVFASKWQVLGNDRDFLRDLHYRDVSLMPALRQELQRAFLKILPECAEMLTTAAQILDEERPNAVIATYETGPWARAIVIQCARTGIPTIGLQHGNIFANHYDYMHRNITTDPVANPAGFVVPRVTCVWGPFCEQVLTKDGFYPRETVAITGNWRYDRITEVARTIDIGEIKSRLGISPETTVVLILSANQNTVDYVTQCLQALATRSGLTPLIRLHPGEDRTAVRKLLKAEGYPDRTLVSGQLAEAILAADLVISQISTAVSEAVLLDRTVVLVNFQNLAGGEAYVESGVCLYVTDRGELAKAIQEALDSPLARAKMSDTRAKFISRFSFKTDGCAAQRVVEVLEREMSLHESRRL
jgi:glycosyltransferase involved in cell wall biosynthesis